MEALFKLQNKTYFETTLFKSQLTHRTNCYISPLNIYKYGEGIVSEIVEEKSKHHEKTI